MDKIDASLKKVCSHLTHKEFVERVYSVLPHDMGYVTIRRLDDLRPEFQDEFFRECFRLLPAQYDYIMRDKYRALYSKF